MEEKPPQCYEPGYSHSWARYRRGVLKCFFCGKERSYFAKINDWQFEVIIPKHPDADESIR